MRLALELFGCLAVLLIFSALALLLLQWAVP